MPTMVRSVPRIAIVEDTSGSMECKQRRQHARAEVRAVLRQMDALVALIDCDAAAADVRWVRGNVDGSWQGGGGTDMRVGIEAAEALMPRLDGVQRPVERWRA